MDFIHHPFDVLGSTNDEAKARARIGALAGTFITAQQQTAGRGRQGRNWVSPVGNLFASLIVRPSLDMSRYGELAFVTALALGETFGSFVPNWQLKWPNDVLIDGAKISGLLLESEPGWVVIGMGANIMHAPDVPGRRTTSLHQLGRGDVTVPLFIQHLQPSLSKWLTIWENEGFAPIRAAWLDHAYGIGQPVRVQLADQSVCAGTFNGIDKDGALLLSEPGQPHQRVLAGDVFFHD